MKYPYYVFLVVVLLSSILVGQPENKHLVGSIDFFGYKGLDVAPIRAALPLREGDTFPGVRSTDDWKQAIRESVQQVIGRSATDVGLVCCDGEKNWTIYIGLPGKSSVPLEFNPAPRGDSRLPPEVLKLDDERDAALRANIMGNNRAKEDDSEGYSLSYDPTMRSKQLALREYSVQNEELLLRVLESSSDARHRAIAATALGYGRQSNQQIAALVKANLDPDFEVRNNAVRALGVVAMAKPEFARQIPASAFIKLLSSPTWVDHNKGAFLLETLSKGRDQNLLKPLKLDALDNLLEMAQWHYAGHAYTARMIIGRIAGIEESRLSELAKTGPVETIIRAL